MRCHASQALTTNTLRCTEATGAQHRPRGKTCSLCRAVSTHRLVVSTLFCQAIVTAANFSSAPKRHAIANWLVALHRLALWSLRAHVDERFVSAKSASAVMADKLAVSARKSYFRPVLVCNYAKFVALSRACKGTRLFCGWTSRSWKPISKDERN